MKFIGSMQEVLATYMVTASIGKPRARRFAIDFLSFNTTEAVMIAGMLCKKDRTVVSVLLSNREVLSSNRVPRQAKPQPCASRDDGGPCEFSPDAEYGQKHHCKAPLCCEHCGRDKRDRDQRVGEPCQDCAGTGKCTACKGTQRLDNGDFCTECDDGRCCTCPGDGRVE